MLEENYLETEKKKKKKKRVIKIMTGNLGALQEEKKSQTQVVCKSSGYSPFYIQIF